MHPELLDILERHPDCYFQIFTNGQFITDAIAAKLRALGNVTPLVSIEGTEIVSDERRGQAKVLTRTLRRPRRLHPPQADHRRRHQRLPDEHRRPAAGIVAARADRARRDLRLVPHLSPGRRQPVGRARAHARAGAARPRASSSRCGRSCRSASSTPTGTTRARRSARWRPASATTSTRGATSSRARSSSSRRRASTTSAISSTSSTTRPTSATSASWRRRRRAAASCSSGPTW